MTDVSLPFCFTRACGEPAARGAIKEEPDDFRVTEELGFEPAGEGEHAFLRIRKIETNTGWIAKRLADLAGVRPFDVGYAGRKDRHAVTEQWFSCYLPGKTDPDWRALERDHGIEVVRVTRHRKKLRKGHHRANRFRIRIRHLTNSDEGLAERLGAVGKNGFPNYFGEQRFGREGGNLHHAEQLFAGGRVPRSKRDLYISAARAYLFNRVLSREVEAGTWCRPAKDGRVRTGPLFGVTRKQPLPDEASPPGFEAWCEGLRKLKVKAARRALCALPEAFDWEFEDHRTLLLSFGLPAGSYATSLLRELIRYEEG